jgi:hypothetical protein
MWFVRLGSRVWGPVSEAELQTLHRRGEFTNIHQISTDQRKWTPATELIFRWKNPSVKTEVAVPTLQVSENGWFYCLPNRQQVGPVSREELVAKARTGEIQSKTLVYDGESKQWVPAYEVSFLGLTRPKKQSALGLMMFALLTIVVCVTTGVGTYFAIRYFKSDSHDTTLPHDSKNVSKP